MFSINKLQLKSNVWLKVPDVCFFFQEIWFGLPRLGHLNSDDRSKIEEHFEGDDDEKILKRCCVLACLILFNLNSFLNNLQNYR